MTEQFPPVLFIDVYKTSPPRYRGKARRQPWRFRVISEGNGRVLAWGEAYTNEADAVAAARLVCGDGATVFLRRAEVGNVCIRRATGTA